MFGSTKASKNPIGSKISKGPVKGIQSAAEVIAPKKGVSGGRKIK